MERNTARSWDKITTLSAGALTALIGGAHLAAWLGGVMAQRGVSAVTMKANTALCLLLLGVGLVLLAAVQAGGGRRWAGRACAGLALLIGALSLGENLFGWNLGIDQLLATEPAGALGTLHPNLMGTPASICFTLAGLALLFLSRRRGWTVWAAQAMALGICLIALLGNIGYLYGVRGLYGVARVTTIAWSTALALLLLGLGLLFARAREGLMAQVTAGDPGGAILRRILLPALLLPVALGWLRLAGERLGWFDAALGTALVMITFITAFSLLAWLAGRWVSRSAAEIARQQELLAVTLTSIGDGVMSCDGAGRVTFLNPVAEGLTGWKNKEAQGQPIQSVFKIINEETRQGAEDIVSRVLHEGHIAMLANHTALLARDGREIPIEDSAAPIRDDAGNVAGVVLVFHNVTEKRRAEDALRASEALLRGTLDAAQESIWLLNAEGVILAGNETALRRMNRPAAEVIGRNFREILPPAVAQRRAVYHDQVIESGQSLEFEDERDGIQFHHNFYPVADAEGRATRLACFSRDITRQKRAEAELRRLNRTLRAISNSSQALMHGSDEAALLARVCEIIVQDCGHAMVWIGYAEDDEHKSIRPVAWKGFEDGYLETLQLTWADTERGRGPKGTAIRTGKPAMCRNMLTEPQYEPWRKEALKRGYASSIALPMMDDRRVFGALSIYSREADPFSEDEVKFLTELADDLAYGIAAVRLRAAKELAEASLRQHREWLRVTLRSIGDGVITCDTEGQVTFLNPVAEALSGWQTAEALGQPIRSVFNIINEQTRQSAEDIVGRVLREKRIVELANHTALVTRDGREVPIEDSAAPIMDASGDVAGVVLVFHDVTEKRRAQEALRESRERLDLALIASRMATFDWDIVQNKRTWSAGVHSLLGTRPETFTGTAEEFFQIMHPEDRGTVQAALAKAVETGLYETEYRAVWPDGGIHYLAARGKVYRDDAGRAVSMTGVCWNITERKLAEDALRRANEQLAAADKRKDEFLAMLAHELRNPLAPIRNAVQILKLAGANEPVREKNRQIIDRQASHMGRLLDDLLDVSRVTRGKIALKLEPLDLRTIAAQAVEVAAPAAQARRLEIHYANPPEPVGLEGDFTRLEQVVGNLINNAIKYSDEGQIQVSVGREPKRGGAGPWAVVRVRDTGIGISPEMLPRVFELFAQADQTLERTRGGLGIGLTMVKRLVDLHGGRVEARSDGLGQGSEFSVLLPLVEKELTEATPAVLAPAPDGPEATPLKVLVVDDNQDAAGSLKELLELWGYEVRTTFDGQEAVQLACTFVPDVVLLDIGLPGMSGYAVARRLREERSLETVRIIALTGYGQEEDRKMTSESGCDAHLVKPVDLHHLQIMLARIMVGS